MKIQQKIILAFLIVLLGLLITCSERKYSTVEDVIYANAEYYTKEDLSGVMMTVHPESAQYSSTELIVEQLFERFDLEFIVEEIEIIEQSDEEAKVRFTQLTMKVSGPEFKNNRIKGNHTLRKSDGSWLIFDTKILETDFIN
jgi:hypothetical protein